MKDCYGVVYLIHNSVNGKCYIGQTVSTVSERWRQHVFASKSGKYALANAIRKHGENAFGWCVLCKSRNQKELDAAEAAWIGRFNAIDREFGYNCRSSVAGHGSLCEESRQKMSLAKRGMKVSREVRERLLHYSKTRPHEEHERKFVSQRHIKNGIRPPAVAYERSAATRRTKEYRELASLKQRGKSIPLEVRGKISNALRGRKFSDSHKDALRRAALLREEKRGIRA